MNNYSNFWLTDDDKDADKKTFLCYKCQWHFANGTPAETGRNLFRSGKQRECVIIYRTALQHLPHEVKYVEL